MHITFIFHIWGFWCPLHSFQFPVLSAAAVGSRTQRDETVLISMNTFGYGLWNTRLTLSSGAWCVFPFFFLLFFFNTIFSDSKNTLLLASLLWTKVFRASVGPGHWLPTCVLWTRGRHEFDFAWLPWTQTQGGTRVPQGRLGVIFSRLYLATVRPMS